MHQRPQHLLGRCAATNRVFFFEEPIYDAGPPRLQVSQAPEGVVIVRPLLPKSNELPEEALLSVLISDFLDEHKVGEPVLWYYTPMALRFTSNLNASAVVYDCMDELSAFAGAPPGLRDSEAALLRRADLVFTGGRTLHENKRKLHPRVHLFPSSIDFEHFSQARSDQPEPEDQKALAHPRLGYCGVIDERMDLQLIDELASLRTDWGFVMLGPVVKIEETSLPRRPNLHYLGMKPYQQLPAYFSGWDLAMLPFARNEATRFISPTKTPEYLAAGLPTVSTSIQDVVSPYGDTGLVRIADEAPSFAAAAEALLQRSALEKRHWLMQVDEFLTSNSWDRTWSAMWELICNVVAERHASLTCAAD